MSVFYLLRSCLARVLARLPVKRVPRVGTPLREAMKPEEGRGAGRERTAAATATNFRRRHRSSCTFTLSSLIPRARPRRTEL